MRRPNFTYDNFAQENGRKKTLSMPIKWVKTDKKIRNEEKSCIFQFAHTNLKTLRKVSLILRRHTTVRRGHLETLTETRTG